MVDEPHEPGGPADDAPAAKDYNSSRSNISPGVVDDSDGGGGDAGGGVRLRALVVEDDDSVRELCRQTLEDEGFEVLVAASGEEALERLAGAEPVQVAVMDIVMPGMDGTELARTLATCQPDMGLLLVSGHDPVALGVDLGGAAFLPKPFSPGQLAAAVSECCTGQTFEKVKIDLRAAGGTGDNGDAGDPTPGAAAARGRDRVRLVGFGTFTSRRSRASLIAVGVAVVVIGTAAGFVVAAMTGEPSDNVVALVADGSGQSQDGNGSEQAGDDSTQSGSIDGDDLPKIRDAELLADCCPPTHRPPPAALDTAAAAAEEDLASTEDTSTQVARDDPVGTPSDEPAPTGDAAPAPGSQTAPEQQPAAPDPQPDPAAQPDPAPQPDQEAQTEPEPEPEPEPQPVSYVAPAKGSPALVECTGRDTEAGIEYTVTFTVHFSGGAYDVLPGEPLAGNGDERLEVRDEPLVWTVTTTHVAEHGDRSRTFDVSSPSAFGWADPGGSTRSHTHMPPALTVSVEDCGMG